MTNPAYVTTAWTGAGATVAGTGLNTVAYEPTLTHRVAMLFQKVATPNVDSTTNAYFDFVPDGSAVKTTRNIVTMNTCATCHAGVKLHEGYTTEYCVICHNQSTLDPFTAEPVDFQRLIHKLHRGKDLPSVVAGGSYVVNGTHNYSYSAFPGNISDCAICHSATATKPGTTTLLEDRNAWYTMPTQRACGTCHDSTTALGHIASNVTASGEQCAFCHSDTSAFGLGVRTVQRSKTRRARDRCKACPASDRRGTLRRACATAIKRRPGSGNVSGSFFVALKPFASPGMAFRSVRKSQTLYRLQCPV